MWTISKNNLRLRFYSKFTNSICKCLEILPFCNDVSSMFLGWISNSIAFDLIFHRQHIGEKDSSYEKRFFSESVWNISIENTIINKMSSYLTASRPLLVCCLSSEKRISSPFVIYHDNGYDCIAVVYETISIV